MAANRARHTASPVAAPRCSAAWSCVAVWPAHGAHLQRRWPRGALCLQPDGDDLRRAALPVDQRAAPVDELVSRADAGGAGALGDRGQPAGGRGSRAGAGSNGSGNGSSGWNGPRYEAALARRRYEAVDPDNRLVARTLERDWEAALPPGASAAGRARAGPRPAAASVEPEASRRRCAAWPRTFRRCGGSVDDGRVTGRRSRGSMLDQVMIQRARARSERADITCRMGRRRSPPATMLRPPGAAVRATARL